MSIKDLMFERNLPPLKSRDEMLEIMLREEYGYLPPKPDSLTFKETDDYISNFCAGKAVSKKVEAVMKINGKDFSFPFYVSIPSKKGKHPFFVCINFRDSVPDRYIPVEEIIDNGFGVLSFCYNDVTMDNTDFTDGLAGILYEDGKRSKHDAGKISMWAWAAHRVMDYAETLPSLNLNMAIVCGHSRLGKTALLAAATDERFKIGYSNDSGCCGAAISRGKVGENLDFICTNISQWFCENFYQYKNREYDQPFDQHYLAAAIAPRYVYIASAEEDTWADPVSEMMTCVAISEAYEKLGMAGFVYEDRLPKVGDQFHEGSVGYHLRAGSHYFSREDWNGVIKFAKKHM